MIGRAAMGLREAAWRGDEPQDRPALQVLRDFKDTGFQVTPNQGWGRETVSGCTTRFVTGACQGFQR